MRVLMHLSETTPPHSINQTILRDRNPQTKGPKCKTHVKFEAAKTLDATSLKLYVRCNISY